MKLESEFKGELVFADIFAGPRYGKLKDSLLTIMLRSKDMLFRKSEDPQGNQWTELSKKAQAKRVEKNMKALQGRSDLSSDEKTKRQSEIDILVDRGVLKNSLTNVSAPYGLRETSGDEVKLGTNVAYAAIHNFGGKIVKATKHKIVGREEQTWNVVITMPKREFMGFSKTDGDQVTEKITAYMNKESGTNG